MSVRRAAAELVLIFVGITLALAFENWNQERQAREQERQILAELARDISETLFDLERDIKVAAEQAAFYEKLIRRFDEPSSELPLGDLFELYRGHTVFAKRAAYESIKSIGMDLVSNDTLRSAVSGFYELTLVRVGLAEAALRSRQQEIVQAVRPLLRVGPVSFGQEIETQLGPATRAVYDLEFSDPETFFADPVMKLQLISYYNVELAALDIYQTLRQEGESLLEMIETELE